METPGQDRYDALLRHLQAGHEIPIQPRRRGLQRLDIHPSAGKVALIAVVVAIVWMGAIQVFDYLRQDRVDTWTGPDATVQSGLRLPGCPSIPFEEDVYFPSWVRFEGKVYRWNDQLFPIGSGSIGKSFLETGYRNGDLELFRIANNPDGRAGKQILLRQGESPAGAVYVLTDCG
jgi:hypothetical protein